MKEITIRIHSFIDIITNSSTEIYIQANDKTISNIKSLIDSILSIGGSKLKCNDIFEMSLRTENPYGEEYEEIEQDDDEYSDMCDVKITAKPLIKGNDAEVAANILSRLTDLFDTGERDY